MIKYYPKGYFHFNECQKELHKKCLERINEALKAFEISVNRTIVIKIPYSIYDFSKIDRNEGTMVLKELVSNIHQKGLTVYYTFKNGNFAEFEITYNT